MSTERKADKPEPNQDSLELLDEELEAVSGGALNAYLKLSGQKSGSIKESMPTQSSETQPGTKP